MLSIGEKIAGIRVTKELTIQMVSQKTGIKDFTIYNYEHDIEKIPYRDLKKIADALGVTVNYLTGVTQSTQAERAELFGSLVNVVENWLEEKGVPVDAIPNNDRKLGESNAYVYGEDYDILCDGFSSVLGISRYADEDAGNVPIENVLNKAELELISACILGQLEVINQTPTLMDENLMRAKDVLTGRLAALNSKICDMMPEDKE